jgi:uncharacterized membrane protein
LKIKIFNWLLTIDILTILLIIAIFLIPFNIIRIIVCLPFLLYFPGYALMAALFPNRRSIPFNNGDRTASNTDKLQEKEQKGMDSIEHFSLNLSISIAISALIGLGLNYTVWGIRLIPITLSISVFIVFMSIIAMLRQRRSIGQWQLTQELSINMPGWEGNAFNKTLTVIIMVVILGSVGLLAYVAVSPKVGERFSEFYILGDDHKAEGYPSVFYLKDNQVIGIQYESQATTSKGGTGKVTLGIVNQEQRNAVYSTAITIDGQPSQIYFEGKILSRIEQIKLQQGEKWEQEVGFIPQHAGDNQKIEFLLYIDGQVEPEDILHLWVNVKEE